MWWSLRSFTRPGLSSLQLPPEGALFFLIKKIFFYFWRCYLEAFCQTVLEEPFQLKKQTGSNGVPDFPTRWPWVTHPTPLRLGVSSYLLCLTAATRSGPENMENKLSPLAEDVSSLELAESPWAPDQLLCRPSLEGKEKLIHSLLQSIWMLAGKPRQCHYPPSPKGVGDPALVSWPNNSHVSPIEKLEIFFFPLVSKVIYNSVPTFIPHRSLWLPRETWYDDGGAGERIQGLAHAMQVLCQWATAQAPLSFRQAIMIAFHNSQSFSPAHCSTKIMFNIINTIR